MDDKNFIYFYHNETKHHLNRYARSLGYLDWANQPNPFRNYSESDVIQLPFGEDPKVNLGSFEESKNVSLNSVGKFLELSMGLSAWKSLGNTSWALRMNPSSGNLHPTEIHIIIWEAKDIQSGIYHYSPYHHALEKRAHLSDNLSQKLKSHFQVQGFLAILTSIYWREAWKYGERSFRYCNHDVGHAIAALSFSANLQNWKVVYIDSFSDKMLNTMLGFEKLSWGKYDKEVPDLACFVTPTKNHTNFQRLPKEILNDFKSLTFHGTPNALSEEYVEWDIIYQVSQKTEKKDIELFPNSQSINEESYSLSPNTIRQRRSAVNFDEQAIMPKDAFLNILKKTMFKGNSKLFNIFGESHIHLLLFVHRVSGVQPGLYFLFRSIDDIQTLQNLTRKDFLWNRVEDNIPLYLLAKGNTEELAIGVSCGQDIAGDSCFSLGMLAKFEDNIEKEPFFYKYLFWESGMIGQVLYIEAEKAGFRGTGIGCFFDDAVHDILGFASSSVYQSLYHFTIGNPVNDTRLTTREPYYHL